MVIMVISFKSSVTLTYLSYMKWEKSIDNKSLSDFSACRGWLPYFEEQDPVNFFLLWNVKQSVLAQSGLKRISEICGK